MYVLMKNRTLPRLTLTLNSLHCICSVSFFLSLFTARSIVFIHNRRKDTAQETRLEIDGEGLSAMDSGAPLLRYVSHEMKLSASAPFSAQKSQWFYVADN